MVNVYIKVSVAQRHGQHGADLVCGIAALGGAKANVKGAKFHGAITKVTTGSS